MPFRPMSRLQIESPLTAFLSGTIWRLVASFLSLAVFTVLARGMGSQTVALYAIAATTLYLLQPLPLLGLQASLIREAAALDASLGRLVRTALAIALPSSTVLAVVLLVVVPPTLAEELQVPIRWIALGVFASGINCTGEVLLTARQRSDLVAMLNVLETLIRGIASLVVIVVGSSPLLLVILLSIGRVALAAAYAVVAIAPAWRLEGAGWASAGVRLVASAPLYAGIVVLATALARMDMLVLAHIASPGDVGRYAVAVKTFEVMTLFSSMAITTAYPMLARLRSSDRASFFAVMSAVIRLCGLVCLPLALGGIAGVPFAVEAVFGTAYRPSGQMASWFVVATLLTLYNQLFSAFFLIEQRPRDDLLALFGSFIATLALLAIWVPKHGAAGAAWSVVGGGMVQLAMRAARCAADSGMLRAGLRLLWTSGVAALAALLVVGGGGPAAAAVSMTAVLLGLCVVTVGRHRYAGVLAQMRAAAS